MTTDHLDRVAHEYMLDHGAYPSTLGYKGFPKSCCTSLNEVICHGIPDSTVIEDGDIVNIDVTAYTRRRARRHQRHLPGRRCLRGAPPAGRAHPRGDHAGHQGRQTGPGSCPSSAGSSRRYANRFGYNVVRDFTGHGIGETFHNGLVVLHYDRPEVQTVLEPGMTFTIEPMINLGSLDYEIWDDGWTVATKDRKWTAQFEHTPGGDRGRCRDPDAGVSALLIAGTTSDAGKSMVVAGLVPAAGAHGEFGSRRSRRRT